MKKQCFILCLLFAFSIVNAQTIMDFNDNWEFQLNGENQVERVSLPHSWNSDEVVSGRYFTKGKGIYTKNYFFDKSLEGKRIFLEFEAVSKEGHVYVNDKFVGQHKGGYSQFTVEITDSVRFDAENEIVVIADNRDMSEILPISGDFNFFGGITRPVSLVIKEKNCISPMFYSTNGVFVMPKSVSHDQAAFSVETKLLIANPSEALTLNTSIYDASGNLVATNRVSSLSDSSTSDFKIDKPVLWNGLDNPYLYTVKVELLSGSDVIDSVVDTFGLRSYSVDPEKGFFLNGDYLKLHGVNRHQDREGYASALLNKHHDEDMEIMLDMGVNSMRLAHYQHADYFYKLCDQKGIVVWAEIPFVAFISNGFNGSKELRENGIQQLRELIYQNLNRPSIFFWGIYNEIKVFDRASSYIEELNVEAKKIDPSRLTVGAANFEGPYTSTPDILGWNQYLGWYGLSPKQFVSWVDRYHRRNPSIAFSISEYGAGGSFEYDRACRIKPLAGGKLHPQSWQLYFHEIYWEKIASSQFIWGSYVWNMFDFSAENRNEGDKAGMNDKGIVSYDRQAKKELFYFYKANWTDSPVCHITGRNIKGSRSEFKVYSNCEYVKLYLNDKFISAVKPDHLKRCVWSRIRLQKGKNIVKAEGFINETKVSEDLVSFDR
ncbi:MAG: DUF4982 domain-containing protein [Spirochaetales bacterium]|nr:DUF4982 domain-containing protein [Spirochaetales bacterium]